ncbi:hypothetical protein ACWD6R_08570 [Streptomyces sp. NPDC005151]
MSPSARPSARPEAQPPLAGRQAGEGRLRPGRPFSPGELAHHDTPHGLPEVQPEVQPVVTTPVAVPAVTPEVSGSPPEGRLAPQALDTPAVRRVQKVSFGAGIALIGLGLGFLAFRLRRPN